MEVRTAQELHLRERGSRITKVTHCFYDCYLLTKGVGWNFPGSTWGEVMLLLFALTDCKLYSILTFMYSFTQDKECQFIDTQLLVKTETIFPYFKESLHFNGCFGLLHISGCFKHQLIGHYCWDEDDNLSVQVASHIFSVSDPLGIRIEFIWSSKLHFRIQTPKTDKYR